MKPGITIIYLFLLPITFLQCTQTKRVMNNKDGNMVTTLVIFPTHSEVDVIETRDKRVKSEALSEEAANEINAQLVKYIPSNINTKYLECDSQLQKEIANSNIKLIKAVKTALNPDKVVVPDFLLHVLDSLGENYGLFLYHGGFTRSYGNITTEYTRRKIIGVASLGFYNTEPNSTYSIMIGILIDKKRKKISMYKELFWRNRDPNEEVVIRSQVRDIILTYFQTSN